MRVLRIEVGQRHDAFDAGNSTEKTLFIASDAMPNFVD